MDTTDTIAIYGKSGHGRVVAQIARAAGYADVVWIDDAPKAGAVTFEAFCEAGARFSVALGIGDNAVRQRLADASLYAPADGIIRNRILEPGDMAFPQTPVMTLAFVDPVWVRAYLPEPMLGRVKLGARAWITTDSYPGKRYEGWVGYVSPTAEFTPKTVQTPELRTRLVYSVRVFACNPRDELRLGMPVSVQIELDAPDGQSAGRPCGDA